MEAELVQGACSSQFYTRGSANRNDVGVAHRDSTHTAERDADCDGRGEGGETGSCGDDERPFHCRICYSDDGDCGSGRQWNLELTLRTSPDPVVRVRSDT